MRGGGGRQKKVIHNGKEIKRHLREIETQRSAAMNGECRKR